MQLQPGGIYIVGIGPGDPQYLTLRARGILERADIIIGFRQVLSIVRNMTGGVMLALDNDVVNTLKYVSMEAKAGKLCVICCWGDPKFSNVEFIKLIREVCEDVKVICGISSIQIACSIHGLPMEEAIFITFHKSGSLDNDKNELLTFLRNSTRKIVLLPRPWDFMPREIAEFLINNNLPPEIKCTIYENLTLENERIRRFRLLDLAHCSERFSDLTIMIIER